MHKEEILTKSKSTDTSLHDKIACRYWLYRDSERV